MAAERTLVRIQAKGQVTLPAEFRRRLGLKAGDLVAVEETPDGVLITPRGAAALKALDDIGAALKEQGVTLEEMIEGGREIREELLMFTRPSSFSATTSPINSATLRSR